MLIKTKKPDNMPLIETEAFRGMWDEYQRHGYIESPSPTQYRNYMANGWICSVEEFDGKWKPMAYKKLNGKDIYIDKMPEFDTRDEAGRALHRMIGSG